MERQPIPPVASRADALGQLRRERWFAVDAGETDRVAELDRQIQLLSAGSSATAPIRETTGRPPTTNRGDRRAAARRAA